MKLECEHTTQQGSDCIFSGKAREVGLKWSDPVFEAVGVLALFAAQVDEEVCGAGSVLRGHVPHDAERVAGHLANLDVARG